MDIIQDKSHKNENYRSNNPTNRQKITNLNLLHPYPKIKNRAIKTKFYLENYYLIKGRTSASTLRNSDAFSCTEDFGGIPGQFTGFERCARPHLRQKI